MTCRMAFLWWAMTALQNRIRFINRYGRKGVKDGLCCHKESYFHVFIWILDPNIKKNPELFIIGSFFGNNITCGIWKRTDKEN